MSVSGGVSASYAVQKTFQKTFQYYMMVHNQMLVQAGFEDYGSAINEPMLKARLSRIPEFDPRSLSTVEQYKSLFATLGSHIITGVNYGGRFQLVGPSLVRRRLKTYFRTTEAFTARLGRQHRQHC